MGYATSFRLNDPIKQPYQKGLLIGFFFYQICSRKLLLQAQRGKWEMNGTAILVQRM
jgi:hypothetical protein